MNNKENLNDEWGVRPQLIILSTNSCTNFALIPERICHNLKLIRIEFLQSLGESYRFNTCGSGSLNLYFLADDFINYININYLKKSKTKAILIGNRNKIEECVLEKLPFKHIYL